MPNTDLTKNFGGFKVINGSADGFNLSGLTDKTVIYFVRTDESKEDGFIYFNGKKYGNGKFSSDKIQTQLQALKKTVDDHIANKATVTPAARTSGADDNGNITADNADKWLSGDAIANIKTYVDSEDVKSMKLVGKEIQLQNTTGAVLAKLDASKFIQDGMLQSVELAESTTEGKVLRFTWNTESGKDKTITDIEVSEFFHEISGDTKTIDVTQPESGTTGSLQISAKTVASVADVTSDATALMTGGITQKYVAQEINSLKTGLTTTVVIESNKVGADDTDPYAVLTIQQTNGEVTTENSSLQVVVATGLTKDHAGFVYNKTNHTFTANATTFTKTGLLDAQEVITLLRNNNTNVADALTYLKGQITTLSGQMPTVTGSTYITVTKAKDTNDYTVSASESLTTAITQANNAVQSVNGNSGTSVTINSSDIALGAKVGENETTASVTEVLQDIYQKLGDTSSASLNSVTGSNGITVGDKQGFTQDISIHAKTLSGADKAAGQIEIITTGATGIYGLLYFGGDDVEA